MSKLNITEGEWEMEGEDFSITIGRADLSYQVADVYGKNQEEMTDNATLIADAGNTYQICKRKPSELLEQRNELLSSLKRCLDVLEDLDDPNITTTNDYQNAVGFSNEAIKKAQGE